jgi:hypothetical protein
MTQQDSNEKFFERADFSAWLAAGRFQSADRMRAGKQETLQHFVQQFQQMLDDNIEDHIRQLEEMAKGKK